MEHHTVGVWPASGGRPSGDDRARFLSELRQLRAYAGLGQLELAVRAHYPHDYIRAAETGPTLPDLPLLSAYIRGCGGTLEEWEERWRQLTNTPALTMLPTRSAGASTAANAGTRLGLSFQPADVPDPAAIMEVLNRVAEKIATETSSPPRLSRPAPPPAVRLSAGSVPPSGPAAKLDLVAAAGRVAMPPSVAAAEPKPARSASVAANPAPPASASPRMAVPASPAPGAGTGAGSGSGTGIRPAPADNRPVGRSFSVTSRTMITALAALAICVIVAVLAIFA